MVGCTSKPKNFPWRHYSTIHKHSCVCSFRLTIKSSHCYQADPETGSNETVSMIAVVTKAKTRCTTPPNVRTWRYPLKCPAQRWLEGLQRVRCSSSIIALTMSCQAQVPSMNEASLLTSSPITLFCIDSGNIRWKSSRQLVWPEFDTN